MLPIPRILVLGDSHTLVFNNDQFFKKIPNYLFEVISVPGATASGLDNPNSKTKASHTFYSAIENEKHDVILLCLGEVDTGFVIWYRAKKYNRDIDEMLHMAIENFGHLIKDCSERSKTIVISAPLPTIDDSNKPGDVRNLRKEITATQLERTELSLRFNRAIKEYCEDREISYVDLDAECLGDNGIVNSSMLCADVADHHYDENITNIILIYRFNKLVYIKTTL
jgi:hypothetical protein